MKFIKQIEGVRVNFVGPAVLCRNEQGRLMITGPDTQTGIDLFDLILWLYSNPLSQFREIVSEPFQPPDCFRHLFNADGTLHD